MADGAVAVSNGELRLRVGAEPGNPDLFLLLLLSSLDLSDTFL